MEATKLSDSEKAAIVRDYQRQANGFDEHYKRPLCEFTYSSGVKLVAETCGAYWLIDAIASHQPPYGSSGPMSEFQAWSLRPRGNEWLLCCEDGNDNVLIEQTIEYSDFPKELAKDKGFRLWLENGVLYLPEER